MFRTLLCLSSGAHDYNVDYHVGRFVLYGLRGLVQSSFDVLVFMNNFCLFGICEFVVCWAVHHCDN